MARDARATVTRKTPYNIFVSRAVRLNVARPISYSNLARGARRFYGDRLTNGWQASGADE